MTQKYHGFTLVEVAIVIMITGIILVQTFQPISSVHLQKQRNATTTLLKKINEAILGYAVLHKRLPCADTNGDGFEDCPNTTGTIPFADLAVKWHDGFGKRPHYIVDSQFITTITIESLPSEIQVHTTGEQYEQYVPAIIWSNAENGTTDLWDGGTFSPKYKDDIYEYINLFILKNHLIKAKLIP